MNHTLRQPGVSEAAIETTLDVLNLLDDSAQLGGDDARRGAVLMRRSDILHELRGGREAVRAVELAAKEHKFHLDDASWTAAHRRWVRVGLAKLEPAEKTIMDRYIQRFADDSLEARAQGVGTGSAGAYRRHSRRCRNCKRQ